MAEKQRWDDQHNPPQHAVPPYNMSSIVAQGGKPRNDLYCRARQVRHVAVHDPFGRRRLGCKRAILLRVRGRLCERFCVPCCCTGCCNESTLKCQDGRAGRWSLVALASGLPPFRRIARSTRVHQSMPERARRRIPPSGRPGPATCIHTCCQQGVSRWPLRPEARSSSLRALPRWSRRGAHRPSASLGVRY